MLGGSGKKKGGVTQSAFSCQREGLTIRGTEFRPEGDNLPIAIVSHGFMANQKTVQQYAKLLAELGYAAFTFDFNGGCVMMGKSDGRTTDMSVLTETRDLMAVIDYTKGLPYTDSERVLLMGCSQGGFVSALVAAKRPEQISGLVLFYPALCIPDDARAGKMMWAKFDPKNPPELIKCGPMKLGKCYVNDVVDMDPFEEIRGFGGEVLIVHGTKDKIVAPAYSERAYQCYQEACAPEKVRLHMIENGAHGFSKKHDVLAMAELKRFAARSGNGADM